MDLTWQFGVERLCRWTTGDPYGPFATTITFGRLADGRWFVHCAGRKARRRDKQEGACVYSATDRGRRLALDTARRWRRTIGGEWVQG